MAGASFGPLLRAGDALARSGMEMAKFGGLGRRYGLLTLRPPLRPELELLDPPPGLEPPTLKSRLLPGLILPPPLKSKAPSDLG